METRNPVLTQRVGHEDRAPLAPPLANHPDYSALLQPGQKAEARQRSRAVDLNAAVARVMTTSDGQALMTWLLQFTLHRPTYDHTRPIADAAAHGLFREGQNSIAYAIVEMATRGSNAPPQTPTQEPSDGQD